MMFSFMERMNSFAEKFQPTALGAVAHFQFETACERPPRSLRSRLPLTRGRFAEGGRGHSPRSRIGGGQQPLRPLRGWETSNLDPFLSRECLRFLIARIRMTSDADSGIVCQHSIETLGHWIGSVSDDDLSGVQRKTDSDTPSVMK